MNNETDQPITLLPWPGMRSVMDRIIEFAAIPDGIDVQARLALEHEFKALIGRENETISKICFAYSGSVAEFDDLRQDALVNIWRGLRSYRGDASERTWIYRVTVNSCLSTIRNQSRHRHESLDKLHGLIDSDNSDKETVESLHRAIRRLDPTERAIIMMWLDELGYDDIASATGLNRNTVATKIRRIKEKIAETFKKENI
ncbi:MAG: RNA polymerase sigma factor [Clostridium sp.]|nr:RNA polymerase sigma factor [Clostridium sp.]